MLESGAIKRLIGRTLSRVGELYKPGTLTRVTITAGADGSNSRTVQTATVSIQIDDCTEAMRAQPGYTSEDVRLIILAEGVPFDEITTDDEITTADGRRWSILGAQLDAVGSHWIGRGVRRK